MKLPKLPRHSCLRCGQPMDPFVLGERGRCSYCGLDVEEMVVIANKLMLLVDKLLGELYTGSDMDYHLRYGANIGDLLDAAVRDTRLKDRIVKRRW